MHTAPPSTGPRLMVMRFFWLFCAAAALFFLAVAAGPRYAQLSAIVPDPELITGQLAPADLRSLENLGLSVRFYAGLFTGLEMLGGLAVFLIGFFIFWKRSGQWYAWILSLGFVTFSLYSSPLSTPLEDLFPGMLPVLVVLRTLGMTSFFYSLLVFPDGRFVPPRVAWLAAFWILFQAISLFVPDLRFRFSIVWQNVGDLISLTVILFFVIAIAAVQVNRFRNYADLVQRQQTRWAVFGIGLVMGSMAIVSMPLIIAPIFNLTPEVILVARMIAFTVILLAQSVLAASFAAAILYSRLWDIDILIRRTASYGLLTGLLVLVYFASVVLLQTIFGALAGQAESPLITVVSTLAIAGLFNPLRIRIQDFIDRRFYRRKYDAEQTLARFAAAARDEVDIEVLSIAILGAVDEAMQPEHVSLWIDQVAPKLISRRSGG